MATMELTKAGDGELIGEFIEHQRQEAFAEIVRRHGAMVLGVCRSALGNVSDAEDAAQAVFMALVQKGPSLRGRTTLAGWLHKVAWFAAAHHKRASAVRAKHEREASKMRHESSPEKQEQLPLDAIHAGLSDMPDKYRLPIILHHLEGRSQEEVASLLDSNVGAIAMRLNRGRQMLRDRMVRAGAVVSAAGLAAVMTSQTSAAVSSAFVASATKMAICAVTAKAAAGAASAQIMELSKGALNMLFVAKIKVAAMLTAAILILGGTAAGTYVAVADGSKTKTTQTKASKTVEVPKAAAAYRAPTGNFSWQQRHVKSLPTGNLEWMPRPFVFEKGDSVRYIDFDGGDDSKDGKTQQTAWKHHPWDSAAAGEAKACKGIQTYVFKGGVVYRGSLKSNESGEPGNPIRLTSDPSWGKGEAIFYGSTQIKGGWKKAGADDAPGIPQSDKIWYIDLGKGYDTDGDKGKHDFSPKFSAIWQVSGDKVERLHIAREPNYDLADPNDPLKNWFVWSDFKGKEGSGTLISPSLKGLGDKNLLDNASIWTEHSFLMGSVHRVNPEKYSPEAGSVSVNSRGADFSRIPKAQVHFMIEDSAKFLDAPGEYYFDVNGPKAGRLYLIPAAGMDPNEAVYEVAQNRFPIWIHDLHDVVISGLEFRYNDPTDGTYGWPRQIGVSPCVRIIGNCSNITVKNCKFYYVANVVVAFPRPVNAGGPYGVYRREIGEFADDVMDNIVISDNDILHVEKGGAIIITGSDAAESDVKFGQLKHVEVLRNRVVDTGFKPGASGGSVYNIPAISVSMPETCEIAGNIVDGSWGNGIITLGGKATGSSNKVPLIRMLVHDNLVENTMYGCNDYGGLEHFQGGPIYIYNNLIRNCVGNKVTGRELGYSLYLDGGFKCYTFNNIIAGNVKADQPEYYNNCGYFMVFGFMDQLFNNTIYHFIRALDGSSGNRSNILGNVMMDCKVTFMGQNRPGDISMAGGGDTGEMGRTGIPTMAYASNVFFGNPKGTEKKGNDAFGYIGGTSKVKGGKAPVYTGNTLEELRDKLQAEKCRLSTMGWHVDEPPLVDAAKKDYRPTDNSGAKDRGVKYFVPWSLARNVGEWNFYKNQANPKAVLGEGFYMTDEYIERSMYYNIPRNDLIVSDCATEDYIAGQLEDWIEGALKFDGKRTASLSQAEMSKSVDYPKGGTYDGSKRETLDMAANSFLVEAYFNAEAGSTGGVIVSKMGDAGYELAINADGRAGLTIRSGDAKATVISKIKINDGNWHHVLAEVDRDAGKAAIYVDGKVSGEGGIDGIAKDASLANTSDFIVGGGFVGAIDFLRVCRSTLAESRTSVEELYEWEFNGPFLRDFCGNVPEGKRDAGAIDLGGKQPAGAARIIEARPELKQK